MKLRISHSGWLAWLFLCASAAFGQTVPKDFKLEYDKFKDTSTLTRNKSYIKGRKSNISVGALIFRPVFSFAGKVPRSDGVRGFVLVFDSITRACHGWCFSRDRELTMLVDGNRLDLGDGQWSYYGESGESMMYFVTEEDFARLAAAREIEFQLGIFEAKFAANDLTAVREMYAYATATR